MIFVDTSYLVALAMRADGLHASARASTDGGATWAVPPDGAARYDMGSVAGI
jgi:predicted nucleic acid-binding protein